MTLKWARANGCPWDFRTCTFAACRGHLAVLEHAVDAGCPFDIHTLLVLGATCGHSHVLRWLDARFPDYPEKTDEQMKGELFEAAGSSGDKRTIEWLEARKLQEPRLR